MFGVVVDSKRLAVNKHLELVLHVGKRFVFGEGIAPLAGEARRRALEKLVCDLEGMVATRLGY